MSLRKSHFGAEGGRSTLESLLIVFLTAVITFAPSVHAASIEARQKGPIGDGMDIRILPIGEWVPHFCCLLRRVSNAIRRVYAYNEGSSITYGGGSPFCPLGAPAKRCNGYRKSLYESLIGRGNKIEFVGGTSAGDFAQPRCEGHRGERIDEITENSLEGINAAPNIVLLHAGTNDAKDQQADYPNAHSHLRGLISLIYEASPDALLFLCTIIPADPSRYNQTASHIPDFNSKIPDLVAHFESRNKKIRLVDMNREFEVEKHLSDGLHPNNEGYEIMAKAFLEAIEDAEDDISNSRGSEPPSSTSPSNCRATPSWLSEGTFAKGVMVCVHLSLYLVLNQIVL